MILVQQLPRGGAQGNALAAHGFRSRATQGNSQVKKKAETSFLRILVGMRECLKSISSTLFFKEK